MIKRLKRFLHRLGGTLPTEYLSRLPDISIRGMREVRIDAHRGLLAYSGERILVKTADRVLCVTGQRMELSSITMHEVRVRGLIFGVETVD